MAVTIDIGEPVKKEEMKVSLGVKPGSAIQNVETAQADPNQVETLDFEPEISEVSPPTEVQSLDEPLDFEPQIEGESPLGNDDMSGYEGTVRNPNDPTSQSFGISQDDLNQVSAPEPVFDGKYDPSMDASLIPGSPENLQKESDQKIEDQYKDYQSGPNALGKTPEDFKPSTRMYEGDNDPWATYKRLSERATGKTLLGAPTVNNTVIPSPIDYENGRGVPSLAVDATRETAKNLLVTGAAMIDEGLGTKYAESIDSWIADPPKARAAMDLLIKDGMKITAGAIAGGKLGSKAGGKVTGDPYGFISQSIAGLGTIFGAVSVMNPDDPNLLVGKNALLPALNGIPVDENGTFSSKLLAKKFNQLEDAFVTAYPAARAVDMAGYAARFVQNSVLGQVIKGFSATAREDSVAQDILYTLGAGSKNEIDNTVAKLREYKDQVFLQSQSSGLDDAVVKRTPMSAIAEGAEKEGNFDLGTKALEIEKDAERQGMSSVITAKEQPVRELQRVQDQAVDSRGGLASIEQTRKLLAGDAVRKAEETSKIVPEAGRMADTERLSLEGQIKQQRDAAKTGVEQDISGVKTQVQDDIARSQLDTEASIAAQQSLDDDIKSGLDGLYRTDPSFAETVDQLGNDTGLDIAQKFRTRETEKALPELVNGIKQIEDISNKNYDAIPEGVPIDLNSFQKVFSDAIEEGAVPNDVQKIISNKLKEGQELDSIDFRTLYKDILPRINGQISKEYGKGVNTDMNKIELLRKISDNIRIDQMDHIATQGDDAVKKLAEKARDYYKETVVRYKKNTNSPMGQLFRVYDDAWNDHLGQYSDDGVDILSIGKNDDVGIQAERTIKSVNDNSLFGSQQVIDFMSEPSYKGDKSALLKIYKGEAAGEIANFLAKNGGDFSKLTPGLIRDALKEKGVVLKKGFPEGVKEIENFITKMSSLKNDKVASEAALKQAQEDAKTVMKSVKKQGDVKIKSAEDAGEQTLKNVKEQTKQILSEGKTQRKTSVDAAKELARQKKEEVYGTVLSKFIEKGDKGKYSVREKQNGYAIFKDLLSKDNNEGKIDDILKRIRESGDVEAQKGVESAYFNHFKEGVQNTVNNKRMNVTETNKFLSENTSRGTYGDKIFGNYKDPEEAKRSVEALKIYSSFIEAVKKEQSKNTSTVMPTGPSGNMTKEAQEAFGFVTRFIFGMLNPTSTRISSTGSRVINMQGANQHAREVRERILSDHDYAEELFMRIRDKLKEGASPELKKAIVAASVLNGKQQVTNSLSDEDEKKVPAGVR